MLPATLLPGPGLGPWGADEVGELLAQCVSGLREAGKARPHCTGCIPGPWAQRPRFSPSSVTAGRLECILMSQPHGGSSGGSLSSTSCEEGVENWVMSCLSVFPRDLAHNEISGTIEDTSGAFTGLDSLSKL